MWRVVIDTLVGKPYVYEIDEPMKVDTAVLIKTALKAHSMNVALAAAPLAIEVVEMTWRLYTKELDGK